MPLQSSFSLYGITLFLFLILFSAKECSKTEPIDDCFSGRKITQTVKMASGHIEQHGKTWVIISDTDPVRHYAPCNFPEDFHQPDQKIKFSGLEKEVYPNERWAGLPFVITSIKATN